MSNHNDIITCHVCRFSLQQPHGREIYGMNEIECVICYETHSSIVALDCGHLLCKKCFFEIGGSLHSQKQNDETHTIYLGKFTNDELCELGLKTMYLKFFKKFLYQQDEHKTFMKDIMKNLISTYQENL